MGLITAVLVIGVTYIAQLLAGLIFPPFSPSTSRGPCIARTAHHGTIDVLVRIIHGLNHATSSTAKLVEQALFGVTVKFTVPGDRGCYWAHCGQRGWAQFTFCRAGHRHSAGVGFTGIGGCIQVSRYSGRSVPFLWLELIWGVGLCAGVDAARLRKRPPQPMNRRRPAAAQFNSAVSPGGLTRLARGALPGRA
ncbi:MAG: hypothetical protein R2854_02920 [Caldilineaceae bacterium]